MKVSIIIRTKNEQQYILKCIKSIKAQIYNNFEVIIVDNSSNDRTLKLIENIDCKIIKFDRKIFNYSRAINIGISKAKGEIICILSAHCIPFDDFWLFNAVVNFNDNSVAGVYSKQLHTSKSKDVDVRSIFQTFKNERIIQTKDFYFNNGSSFIKKELLKKINFDEKVKSLEDLVWAKKILKMNYKIIYEPTSKVFHYHGPNQSDLSKRLTLHSKIIKKLLNN